jgi:NAD(P)-dependent dehydrogenase (short-subunit alcohol dehydrogenase family)
VVLVTGAPAPGSAAPSRSPWRRTARPSPSPDIDLAAAQRTASEAAGSNRRAIAIQADCGDVASIEAIVARTIAELSQSSSTTPGSPVTPTFMDLTEADWDRIHRVNAMSVFFFCREPRAR